MNGFSVFDIFQSGVVLQRNKPIKIWGKAENGSSIKVTMLNCKQAVIAEATAIADCDEWSVTLSACDAGVDYQLILECNEYEKQIIISNVSIGDVWLAGGQSNMEFFLRYDEEWDCVKDYSHNKNIRMYNVPQLAFKGHQRDTTGWGKWISEGDVGFETFSAVGYSFARNIQPEIGVPIGIIGCYWGGTTATAWLDENVLNKDPLSIYLEEYEEALKLYTPEEMAQISLKAWEFETSKKHEQEFMPLLYGREWDWQEQYMKEHASDPVIPMGPYSINRPGGLFHEMLEPLIPFAIKGVLWYQGESDVIHAEMYDILLSSLVQYWRMRWDDDFPFLFVQLAPFGKWLQCDAIRYHILRERQEMVSENLSNTGMVSIMDIGSFYDIHPKKKLEVGRRLALLARGKVYGEDILCESPKIQDISLNDSRTEISLVFSHCKNLSVKELDTKPLNVPMEIENTKEYPFSKIISNERIKSFCVEQNGKRILIHEIIIADNKIVLSIDELDKLPYTVSLGYADYAEINVVNEIGLPIKPFCKTISD